MSLRSWGILLQQIHWRSFLCMTLRAYCQVTWRSVQERCYYLWNAKTVENFFFAFSITPPHPYPLPLGHFPFTPNCDWMHNKWTPSECLLHVLVCPGHMVGKVRYICIMLVSDVHTLYHSCLFRIVAKRSCYLV